MANSNTPAGHNVYMMFGSQRFNVDLRQLVNQEQTGTPQHSSHQLTTMPQPPVQTGFTGHGHFADPVAQQQSYISPYPVFAANNSHSAGFVVNQQQFNFSQGSSQPTDSTYTQGGPPPVYSPGVVGTNYFPTGPLPSQQQFAPQAQAQGGQYSQSAFSAPVQNDFVPQNAVSSPTKPYELALNQPGQYDQGTFTTPAQSQIFARTATGLSPSSYQQALKQKELYEQSKLTTPAQSPFVAQNAVSAFAQPHQGIQQQRVQQHQQQRDVVIAAANSSEAIDLTKEVEAILAAPEAQLAERGRKRKGGVVGEEESAPAPKKRGRPRKVRPAEEEGVVKVKRKVGRPRKVQPVQEPTPVPTDDEPEDDASLRAQLLAALSENLKEGDQSGAIEEQADDIAVAVQDEVVNSFDDENHNTPAGIYEAVECPYQLQGYEQDNGATPLFLENNNIPAGNDEAVECPYQLQGYDQDSGATPPFFEDYFPTAHQDFSAPFLQDFSAPFLQDFSAPFLEDLFPATYQDKADTPMSVAEVDRLLEEMERKKQEEGRVEPAAHDDDYSDPSFGDFGITEDVKVDRVPQEQAAAPVAYPFDGFADFSVSADVGTESWKSDSFLGGTEN